jgi:nucleoid-associated protein YgaU
MNTTTNAKPITLNENQIAVLTHAIDHTQGKIEWFPDNIKGGARQKVLEGLFKRAMIIGNQGDWHVTAEGYDALGRPRPGQRTVTKPAQDDTKATKAPKAARKAMAAPKGAAAGEQAAPRTRENSKQAQVIAMLKRPEGATIKQVCEATDWQAHTVRGTFAGAFKKKLGLTITSDKAEGGERVYRIA